MDSLKKNYRKSKKRAKKSFFLFQLLNLSEEKLLKKILKTQRISILIQNRKAI